MSTHLTDNQRMTMNAFNADKKAYSFWDQGYVAEDSGTYRSEFISEIAHNIGKPESTAKTVLTSLIKKGIFTTREVPAEEPIMTTDGKTEVQPGKPADQWIELTEAGVELISDLRIEDDEAMLEMTDMDDEDEEPIQTKSIAALEADKRVKEHRKNQKQLKEAAQEDIKAGKPGMRTSHADCKHATQGKEGKMARAKCRRERAAAALKAEEKASKKKEKAHA